MKMAYLYASLLVFAHVAGAADILRRKSASAVKAISLDKLAQPTECVDKDSRCSQWASNGECAKNPAYMVANCPVSCKTCTESTKIGPYHTKHPHAILHSCVYDFLFCKWCLYALVPYIPYAILVFVIAAIWVFAGGRMAPRPERDTKRFQDFEFGLFETDRMCGSHMWICMCAFCCMPIRMADTYSKEGKVRPVIKSFWVALALALLMSLFASMACILGMLLFLGMAVYFRQKIREAEGLPHGPATVPWDCLFWCLCPWCTAAQEARQIEKVGKHAYGAAPAQSVGFVPNQRISPPTSFVPERVASPIKTYTAPPTMTYAPPASTEYVVAAPITTVAYTSPAPVVEPRELISGPIAGYQIPAYTGSVQSPLSSGVVVTTPGTGFATTDYRIAPATTGSIGSPLTSGVVEQIAPMPVGNLGMEYGAYQGTIPASSMGGVVQSGNYGVVQSGNYAPGGY